MAKKTSIKSAPEKKPKAAAKKRSTSLDLSRSPAMKQLIGQAGDIYGDIKNGRRPSLRIPIRGLSNVTFSPRKGFFTIGDKVSKRTLSYQTVKPFAQSRAHDGIFKKPDRDR